MALLLSAIAAHLENSHLVGEDCLIERLSPVETAQSGALSFVHGPKFAHFLAHCQASALLVTEPWASRVPSGVSKIIVTDAYSAFARVTQLWKAHHRPNPPQGIHPTAVVDPSAVLAEGVTLGAYVVVGAHARVGAGTRIGPHVCIGDGAVIGDDCRLYARVHVGEGCQVGHRCVFHPGVVIGADGFGFAPDQGRWLKIEQLGAVRIGNDVELGANTCVDRGALNDTVIEEGVKVDNLVQIGHNVHLGAHTALAGCVGIAGSAVIGAHCTVGGGAVVLGHLSLADHVHVSAASVVTKSIRKAGHYSGIFPLEENAAWEKNAATLKQLHTLRDRVKKLEQK